MAVLSGQDFLGETGAIVGAPAWLADRRGQSQPAAGSGGRPKLFHRRCEIVSRRPDPGDTAGRSEFRRRARRGRRPDRRYAGGPSRRAVSSRGTELDLSGNDNGRFGNCWYTSAQKAAFFARFAARRGRAAPAVPAAREEVRAG